jgi:hypothetical protein
MNFYALDLETESLDSEHPEYALQPWRVQEGKAKISLMGSGPWKILARHYTLEDTLLPLRMTLSTLSNRPTYVWTWNGIFDIAFLIASGVDCSKVKWLDAMSAIKWCIEGQRTNHPTRKKVYSYALDNVAKDVLKDWEHYEEFMEIKGVEEIPRAYYCPLCEIGGCPNHGHDYLDKQRKEYWRRRCELDTEATYLIGMWCKERMTEREWNGFLIEQDSMYLVAKAWVEGYPYNYEGLAGLESTILKRLEQIRSELCLDSKVLASPQQLAKVVYETWGMRWDKDTMSTDKGAKSVDKGALVFLIEENQDKRLSLIKEYRDLIGKFNKFVKGPKKVREYLGQDLMHHVWKLNSTYTGRCTVSSTVKVK